MSNQTVVAKLSKKKIGSVEELALLASNGVLVSCDSVSYLEQPRKVEVVLKLSVGSVLKMIDRGLYAHGVEDSAPGGSILADSRDGIRKTGLSCSDIAEIVGVTRQAVQKFMKAESVQTKTLDKYMRALGLWRS